MTFFMLLDSLRLNFQNRIYCTKKVKKSQKIKKSKNQKKSKKSNAVTLCRGARPCVSGAPISQTILKTIKFNLFSLIYENMLYFRRTAVRLYVGNLA